MMPSFTSSSVFVGLKIATISPNTIAIDGAAAPEMQDEISPIMTSIFWLQLEYLNNLQKEMRGYFGSLAFSAAGFKSSLSSALVVSLAVFGSV